MNGIELLNQYSEIMTRSINVENTLYVLMRAVDEDAIDEGAYLREAEQMRNALDIIAEYQGRTTTDMLDLEDKLSAYIKATSLQSEIHPLHNHKGYAVGVFLLRGCTYTCSACCCDFLIQTRASFAL